jgi:hypothetical protein
MTNILCNSACLLSIFDQFQILVKNPPIGQGVGCGIPAEVLPSDKTPLSLYRHNGNFSGGYKNARVS